MKTYWSAIISLFFIFGCGSEDFGTAPQNTTSKANAIQSFEQVSCSSFTLIRPKVDILYLVDNSGSTAFVADDIKNAVRNTVNTISKEFDYRMVGAPLMGIDSTPFNDYQVMTNSQDTLNSEATSRRIISASELNFFSTPVSGQEKGTQRAIDFINHHVAGSTGLFRPGAYLLIVVVSNGRDTDLEFTGQFGNGSVETNPTNFANRLSSFKYIKDTLLESQQLRLFSVTADTNCQNGWFSSVHSYIKMSRELYDYNGATDNNVNKDHYNLCNGVTGVFAAVNNSIKEVVIPHSYRFWPITFAENNETVDLNEIQVFKVSNNSAPILIPSSSWNYRNLPGGVNTRILPTVGEFLSNSHFVEFNSGSYVTFPECVQVKSVSRTEFFGFIVLPKEPRVDTIVVRINGQTIPQSATNGWTYVGNRLNQNLKVPHPNAGDELPAVIKSGFMLQLNGSSNFYKSGDSVEVNFLPAVIN